MANTVTVEEKASATDARWYLECFAGLRAVQGKQTVERFRTQKTAALLALLALRGGQSREAICTMLWPDSAPDAARTSLSTALSALRRDLGDVFFADRHFVALLPGCFSTDVTAFDEAVTAKNLARAVEIYSGHLLPGFHEDPFPTLASEYEEKARSAVIARLEELEAAYSDKPASDPKAVLALVRRATTLFGDDERWFIISMRAHRQAADFDEALKVYESLQRWTRKQGDLTSDVARQLAKAIRRDKEYSAAHPSSMLAVTPPSESNQLPVPIPSNLPTQWTRFFGRDAEREVLSQWLQGGEKLITISGAGGAGKTRLVIEAVGEIAPDWPGRVAFVPLASLTDAELLYSTIRDALHLAVAPDLPPLEQLQRALQNQRCLLVLDNFEQLAETGATLLQRLREKLPDATFLVTSRVLLRLPGEREFPLSPLPTPLQGTSLASITDFPSAALFCDRANLQVDESNVEALGALCRRLDGIPLALELAAARAKVLTPAQILERLERHPDFLQSREFGLPSRHKTLRATIEWSVGLLSPELRDFFVRLCAFRGGWTLEAAEEVCSPGLCEPWEAVDYLEQLRDHSLLLTQETPSGTRYRLLEMLREWAESQCDDVSRHDLQARHFTYYLNLAQSALDPMLLAARLGELDCETPNFRAALRFALNESDPNPAARLTGALAGLWEMRALNAEGREWAERALQKAGSVSTSLQPATCARLLLCSGAMNWLCGSYKRALEVLEEALQLFRDLEDERGEAAALDYRAKVVGVMGNSLQGRSDGFHVVALARKHNDIARLMSALITTAWGCLNAGYQDEAIACLDECIALGEAANLWPVVATCRATKPFPLILSGRVEESVRASLYSLETLDENSGIWATALARGSAGMIALAVGDIDRARELLPSVTLNFHAISTRWEVASMLSECGGLAMALGDYERAVLIYGATEALRERCGHVMLACLRPGYEANLARLETVLDPTTRQTLWMRGRTLSLDEAVALTQALG